VGVVKNPVLRFKNDKGEDYPDWESKRLGEIGELLKSGNSFNPEFQGNTTDTIPFIKVSDFNHIENNIYIFKYNNTVSQQLATKNSYYIFPRNTIIFAKVGEALRLNRKKLLNIPTIIDNNLMGLYFNEDKNNIFFIYYSFLLINIEEYSNGGTLPSINNKSVYEIPIPIPHIEEQNKIGKFLKSVDDKIEITNQKLNHLKTYKTALMQQLFPSTH
jgi:type I restriction enzyme S subunit